MLGPCGSAPWRPGPGASWHGPGSSAVPCSALDRCPARSHRGIQARPAAGWLSPRAARWAGGSLLRGGRGVSACCTACPAPGLHGRLPPLLSPQPAALGSARPDPPTRPLPPDPPPKVTPGPGWGSRAAPPPHAWLLTSAQGAVAQPRCPPPCRRALAPPNCPHGCQALELSCWLLLSHCPRSLRPGAPLGQAAPPHTPAARGPPGARHSGNSARQQHRCVGQDGVRLGRALPGQRRRFGPPKPSRWLG